MKYDYMVKYNGEYYTAGEDVPIGVSLDKSSYEADDMELPFSDNDIELENKPHTYTYEELEEMTAKEMRRIAEDRGFKLSKVSKDDIISEFLSKQ